LHPFYSFDNLPFDFESRLFRHWNERFGRRPESKPFLSGDTYRGLADHLHDETQRIRDPRAVQENEIIFVSSWMLDDFQSNVLPHIRNRFVLISHQGDVNIEEKHRALADHQLLKHWFAQNACIRHERITALPIGLEDQRRHENGNIHDFRRLRNGKDFRKSGRTPRVVRGFSLGTNPDARYPCYRALHRLPLAADFWWPMNARIYRQELVKYQFVASPPGNGMDCHRTWEAMYLRVVPIVIRNEMNSSFFELGLPMVLVDHWDEIKDWTPEFLDKRYSELSPGFDHEALWFSWWEKKIADAAAPRRP